MKQFEIARSIKVEGWWGTEVLKVGTPVSKVKKDVSGPTLFGIVNINGKRVRLDFKPSELREVQPETPLGEGYVEKRFMEVV